MSELPGRIVQGIGDMLRAAFIPSDDYLDRELGELRTVVEQKFAAFGQVRDAFVAVVQAFRDMEEGEWSGIEQEGSFYGLGGSYTVSVSPVFVTQVAPKIRFWVSGMWYVLAVGWVIRSIVRIIQI